MEDFIFPASKLIIDARNGNGKENSFVFVFLLFLSQIMFIEAFSQTPVMPVLKQYCLFL